MRHSRYASAAISFLISGAREFQEEFFGIFAADALAQFVERSRCNETAVFEDHDPVAELLRLLDHVRAYDDRFTRRA